MDKTKTQTAKIQQQKNNNTKKLKYSENGFYLISSLTSLQWSMS